MKRFPWRRQGLRTFYWLAPGAVAGSSLPHSAEDVERWRREGVRAVISLTRRQPRVDGFDALHLPVRDFAPPTPEQLDASLRFIEEHLARNEAVVVHCRGGKGRTGTVLAAWLVSRGLGADEAIRRVRELAPGSIETSGQAEAVRRQAVQKEVK